MILVRKKHCAKKREPLWLPKFEHYLSHALNIRISISMVVQSVSSMLATGWDVVAVPALMLVADVVLALTVGVIVLSSVVIIVLPLSLLQ